MQLHCEKPSWTHSCTINAYDLPREGNSRTAGLGASPSMSLTPLCILILDCHMPILAIFRECLGNAVRGLLLMPAAPALLSGLWHAVAWGLVLMCAPPQHRESEKFHKGSQSSAGGQCHCPQVNNHPQARPPHVTSPCEEAQAPGDHPASSSLVPWRQLSPSPPAPHMCTWLDGNHITTPNQITAVSFVPIGWDFNWIHSFVVQTRLVQTQGRA